MFRRILIALNILLLVTACAIPISRNHDINTAMERYENAYREIVRDDPRTAENIAVMADVLETIDRRYVDDVNPEQLIDRAIKALAATPDDSKAPFETDPTTRALNAMLASMDRFTGYMAPQHFSTYRERLDGHFIGRGVHIRMVEGDLTIMDLLKGTGAEAADLRAKDIITHVDGNPIKGLTLQEARALLRGPEDSIAELTIRRPPLTDPMLVAVTRKEVEVPSVAHRVEGNVGYIRIYSFTRKTGSGVTAALRDIDRELGSGLCGIVLDMRNNPGGLVSAAEMVADAFLDGGNIYSVENRGHRMIVREAEHGDQARGTPIVVMLNKKSA